VVVSELESLPLADFEDFLDDGIQSILLFA
jgi:hypothetical protein